MQRRFAPVQIDPLEYASSEQPVSPGTRAAIRALAAINFASGIAFAVSYLVTVNGGGLYPVVYYLFLVVAFVFEATFWALVVWMIFLGRRGLAVVPLWLRIWLLLGACEAIGFVVLLALLFFSSGPM
jgi:hypothetical protein